MQVLTINERTYLIPIVETLMKTKSSFRVPSDHTQLVDSLGRLSTRTSEGGNLATIGQAQAVRAVRKMFGSGQYTLKDSSCWMLSAVVNSFRVGLSVGLSDGCKYYEVIPITKIFGIRGTNRWKV